MDFKATQQGSGSQSATAQERRAAPRVGSSRKVVCYPANSGLRERRQGRIRDVSRVGIGLSVDRAFPPGSVLMVEISVPDGSKTLKARVVHSTPLMGSMYLIGCAFDTALTDEDVQSLT